MTAGSLSLRTKEKEKGYHGRDDTGEKKRMFEFRPKKYKDRNGTEHKT